MKVNDPSKSVSVAWSANGRKDDIAIVTSEIRLTAYYATALIVIGLITLISHILQEQSLESGQGMAAVINVSGRQRMLSQRILSLAEQYREGDPSARQEMVNAIDEFEKAHHQLASEYLPAGGSDAEKVLHKVYFSGPNSLDREVANYVQDARKVSALPANDPAMAPLLAEMSAEARFPLLTALNAVVKIHQQASEVRLSRLRRLQFVLLAIMGTTLGLEALLIFRPLVNKIVGLSRVLVYQATSDPLTGVTNRRGFTERSLAEFHRFQRYQRPLTAVAVDIDHFKRINDLHGHDAGDVVLKSIGELLAHRVRPTDIVGRLGGEEFAVLLPETTLEGAGVSAERLRHAIASLDIKHEGKVLNVTASFGVASVHPEATGVDAALTLADKLLYLAKQAGRNCVIVENSPQHAEMSRLQLEEGIASRELPVQPAFHLDGVAARLDA